GVQQRLRARCDVCVLTVQEQTTQTHTELGGTRLAGTHHVEALFTQPHRQLTHLCGLTRALTTLDDDERTGGGGFCFLLTPGRDTRQGGEQFRKEAGTGLGVVLIDRAVATRAVGQGGQPQTLGDDAPAVGLESSRSPDGTASADVAAS